MKTRVSERGQVSIPAEIRKRLGIVPEQELEWDVAGNTILVRPVPKDPIAAFRGAGKKAYTTADLLKDRRAERERENETDKKRKV
jgi:AbrB family looped-hinge helix DNA binding protein